MFPRFSMTARPLQEMRPPPTAHTAAHTRTGDGHSMGRGRGHGRDPGGRRVRLERSGPITTPRGGRAVSFSRRPSPAQSPSRDLPPPPPCDGGSGWQCCRRRRHRLLPEGVLRPGEFVPEPDAEFSRAVEVVARCGDRRRGILPVALLELPVGQGNGQALTHLQECPWQLHPKRVEVAEHGPGNGTCDGRLSSGLSESEHGRRHGGRGGHWAATDVVISHTRSVAERCVRDLNNGRTSEDEVPARRLSPERRLPLA
ncbi:MAG: hypothetical protein QOE37_911 [Microbacteriaceae bacterium]|nr:hypothetical protein [Microbacteriaceae bacterium]